MEAAQSIPQGRKPTVALKDDYYKRNREWVLAKKKAKRQGLPPPPRPEDWQPKLKEKPAVDPSIEQAKKQIRRLHNLLYMSEYNKKYYAEHADEIIAKERERRAKRREERHPFKEPDRDLRLAKMREDLERLKGSLGVST